MEVMLSSCPSLLGRPERHDFQELRLDKDRDEKLTPAIDQMLRTQLVFHCLKSPHCGSKYLFGKNDKFDKVDGIIMQFPLKFEK